MDIYEMKAYLAKIETLKKKIDTLKATIDENTYYKEDLSKFHDPSFEEPYLNITLRVLNDKDVIEAIIKAYDKLIEADSIDMVKDIEELDKLESIEFEVKDAN